MYAPTEDELAKTRCTLYSHWIYVPIQQKPSAIQGNPEEKLRDPISLSGLNREFYANQSRFVIKLNICRVEGMGNVGAQGLRPDPNACALIDVPHQTGNRYKNNRVLHKSQDFCLIYKYRLIRRRLWRVQCRG